MNAADLRAAIALAAKLPRPPALPPSRPANASDAIAKRAERLKGYGKRRGPKNRKKLCAPLNCYPFADWWRRAVIKAEHYETKHGTI